MPGTSNWSNHLYESIFSGCVPVIVGDRIVPAFEHLVDWSKVAVRWKESSFLSDPVELVEGLRTWNLSRVDTFRMNVLDVGCWFDYTRIHDTTCSPYIAIVRALRSFESPTSERMAAFSRHLHTDYYYHLGLDTDMDLRGIFGDVKFVVLMGSAARAELFAEAMANAIVSKGMAKPAVARLGKTERYSMYKVGPVIAVSHGMGGPSLHILVNELAKLCDRAGIIDSVKWIRMGTSGGCGVPPGTVVVTTQAMNEEVEPFWRCVQLGKVVKVPTDCVDMSFVDAILESVPEGISAVKGKTMAADDFYEGQGRLDGALETWYNEEDKMAFMKRLYDAGVRNIEMESVAMMGFCNRANITAACVCVDHR
ncbi:Uridine phosphorylase 2 [Perkinsus olseni]|uniref:Uridine phosphorylase 2 n=1 Tax=Perkinsus olseni TaxID=32597 RepID=A0A7J6PM09_PEROL|nr:Uridine phosphorylase 2 [Perkinsus olseni]